MKKLVERIVDGCIILALVWLCLTICGCHTFHGVGRDITTITEPYITDAE